MPREDYDFIPRGSSSSSALPTNIVQIIESNTGVQTDVYTDYTEVQYSNGLPSVVRKYENASKQNLIYTITPVFSNGTIVSVTTTNHKDNITLVKTVSTDQSGNTIINITRS